MRRCSFHGCGNLHKAKGYCEKHYKQWKKGTLRELIVLEGGHSKRSKGIRNRSVRKGDGSSAAPEDARRGKAGKIITASGDNCCRVIGCSSRAKTNGYCVVHYNRLLLIMTKNVQNGLQVQTDDNCEDAAEVTDEVAYPEDLDEMESDSSIFLYDYLDKGIPSDSDYE